MLTYIIRRLLWSVVLLLVVSLIVFLVFYILPSADPAELRAGRNPDPELVKAIEKQLGLDQPVYVQYGKFVKKIVTKGSLGRSYQNNVEVREEIFSRVPATISLALGAAFVWLVVGLAIGMISAIRRGSLLDRLAMGAALVAISAPVYWLGLVSIYLFSKDIGVLWPVFEPPGTYVGISDDPGQWFRSLILPWVVLATAFSAVYARFMRSNLLETMGEDYVRTARAKGLKERTVVRHGVRAAITPIVTIFGLDLGILLGGAILTESVFNIPGIGRTAFEAISKGDIPIVQGAVIVGACAIVLLNLIVDVIYAFIDPRVRY